MRPRALHKPPYGAKKQNREMRPLSRSFSFPFAISCKSLSHISAPRSALLCRCHLESNASSFSFASFPPRWCGTGLALEALGLTWGSEGGTPGEWARVNPPPALGGPICQVACRFSQASYHVSVSVPASVASTRPIHARSRRMSSWAELLVQLTRAAPPPEEIQRMFIPYGWIFDHPPFDSSTERAGLGQEVLVRPFVLLLCGNYRHTVGGSPQLQLTACHLFSVELSAACPHWLQPCNVADSRDSSRDNRDATKRGYGHLCVFIGWQVA
ncbi:hypothetical protein LY78DRAFT_300576 [Colletotrichum sublineola]|nr:hypothetical protein LY78DRAFT_300576 [Colletotrichum sublineola]